jgi:hypothetical protein
MSILEFRMASQEKKTMARMETRMVTGWRRADEINFIIG